MDDAYAERLILSRSEYWAGFVFGRKAHTTPRVDRITHCHASVDASHTDIRLQLCAPNEHDLAGVACLGIRLLLHAGKITCVPAENRFFVPFTLKQFFLVDNMLKVDRPLFPC